ncbi:MAG: hypothetical protein KAR11_09160 [Phycisphaerae bacterium]|nr:hypothetical protein [Phycisphaerae bacterium]
MSGGFGFDFTLGRRGDFQAILFLFKQTTQGRQNHNDNYRQPTANAIVIG